MEQRKKGEAQVGCSAEGHVSHIYADRMSSRPLGWSREGVDKMARLRIYHANKGDMLELVRHQKAGKAAGRSDIYKYRNVSGREKTEEGIGETGRSKDIQHPISTSEKDSKF